MNGNRLAQGGLARQGTRLAQIWFTWGVAVILGLLSVVFGPEAVLYRDGEIPSWPIVFVGFLGGLSSTRLLACSLIAKAELGSIAWYLAGPIGSCLSFLSAVLWGSLMSWILTMAAFPDSDVTFHDYVFRPLVAFAAYGALPAVGFGLGYGWQMHRKHRSSVRECP